jgi:hypothetical protein
VSENLDFYVDQKSYKEILLETHGVQEENIRYSEFVYLATPLPITIDVMRSNLDQGDVYNIICDKVCQ